MKAQVAIKEKLKMTEQTKLQIHGALQQDYLKIMTANLPHLDTLSALINLDQQYHDHIMRELSDTHQALEQQHSSYVVECVGLHT